MASDLFDQLAAEEVPPLPLQFERGVHQRLNRTLLVRHLLDFAVGAIPSLIIHFAAAVWGLLHFTVLGRYPKRDDGNQQ